MPNRSRLLVQVVLNPVPQRRQRQHAPLRVEVVDKGVLVGSYCNPAVDYCEVEVCVDVLHNTFIIKQLDGNVNSNVRRLCNLYAAS